MMITKNTKPKRKRCKQCSALYEPKNSLQVVCSTKCAIEYTKDKEQRKSVIKTASESDRREVKQKLRQLGKSDRSKALRAAQKAFNAFIRGRDKRLNCISCGGSLKEFSGIKGQLFDAGHYRSTGSAPELRFCELNCHAQCVRCNRYLSGNVERYRDGLKTRIGTSKLEWLEGPHETKKYTVDELWEIERVYKEKKKALEND